MWINNKVKKYKDKIFPYEFWEIMDKIKEKSDCLHDRCSSCNGTGRKRNGEMCIHMISCRCNKCSVKCRL